MRMGENQQRGLLDELSVPDPIHRVSGWSSVDSARKKFLDLLTRQDRRTEQRRIRSSGDLLLGAGGLTASDYRYTRTALSQLCSRLSPHVGSVIKHLCEFDANLHVEHSQKGQAGNLARRLLNDLIELKFQAELKGERLIIDHDQKLIVGLVGQQYALVSNLQVFQQCLRQKKLFSGAILQGRRMGLWFCEHRVFSQVRTPSRDPDRYRVGFYVSNSDVGECAISARPAIILGGCGAAAVSRPTVSGRLIHKQGPKLNTSLPSLLQHAKLPDDRVVKLQNGLGRLCECRLQLGGDGPRHSKRVKSLERKLRSQLHSIAMAGRVVMNAVWQGSQEQFDTRLDSQTLLRLSRRTAYDLFRAVIREAQRYSPNLREAAEGFAYRLLCEDPEFLLGVRSSSD